MRLAVIGCGYVGLVTGSCLADAGHEVIATDNDLARIELLNSGHLPIYEPGLDRVMHSATSAGRLSFTSDCAQAARAADAIFICVGTPPLDSGEADLSAIDNVARQIAAAVPLAETGDREEHSARAHGRGTSSRLAGLRPQQWS